ncbi:MAG: DNA polymerase I [Candidatus Omnitrophota bacterium]|jgi:DNA polymerase-1|nr:MAG: DNA polymerase I [Candidatus Omnitrophota bacterium]
MSSHRLYLIDATAFCYRAFYAIRNLSTSYGQPTNAVYGFIKMLQKIVKEQKPDFMAMCFDVSRDTFRQKKFAEYKIQRPPMPEALSGQMSLIRDIIKAYRIALFELENYEADDIIASLARKAQEAKIAVTVVSSDKDMLQLVNATTMVFNPYKENGILYDEKTVKEHFKVAPAAIPDVIALMGDAADNIPGVPGIGEKTAVELIARFGSAGELLRTLDTLAEGKLRQSIESHRKQIELNYELALLKRDIDMEFDINTLAVRQPDTHKLFELFNLLEFKALLAEMSLGEKKPLGEARAFVKEAQLDAIARESKEIILCLDATGAVALGASGDVFAVENLTGRFEKLLSDEKIKKVGHDLKRLKVFFSKKGLDIAGLGFDVMIAAYLIDPSRLSYTLNDLAYTFLDKYVPAGTLNAAESVSLVTELRPVLEKKLSGQSLDALFYEIEMPLIAVLADMELTGITLDLEVLRQISSKLEAKLALLVKKIYELSGVEFNLNSPKQLREVLFQRLQLPVVKRSKTGPSTDEEVLTRLSSRHELPGLLLEYRQLMKLKSSYLDTLPALVDPNTKKIHTSFNQTGTETGRLSSSNPNLQNIPVKTDLGRQIRRALVVSSGNNVLLSCDYSQIELRILAHLSQDPDLIAAFENDEDIHKTTAALLYGVKAPEVSEKMRDTAKRVNFGIIYGLTSYGLSRDLAISNDEAQRFIESYFLRYPRVEEYMKQQIEKAQQDGYVSTLLGRRRYLPQIRNKQIGIRQFAQRQAINAPIQGSASDMIKLAMVHIHRQIIEKNLRTKMILQIHDELLFEIPQEELAEALLFIKERMENVLNLKVPVKVDLKVGKNWLEMKEVGDEDFVLRK